MYSVMPLTKAERVHIRIDDDMKERAIAVAQLRGVGTLTALVTNLLKEAINHEMLTRPDLFTDEIKKVRSSRGGIRQSVPVGSPANIADRNHDKRKVPEQKPLAKRRNIKR